MCNRVRRRSSGRRLSSNHSYDRCRSSYLSRDRYRSNSHSYDRCRNSHGRRHRLSHGLRRRLSPTRHRSSARAADSSTGIMANRKITSIEVRLLNGVHQGPRIAVGLGASGGCDFNSGDFDFEAAEVWVIVFADAIDKIDEAACFEGEFVGAASQVPSDSAHGAA